MSSRKCQKRKATAPTTEEGLQASGETPEATEGKTLDIVLKEKDTQEAQDCAGTIGAST